MYCFYPYHAVSVENNSYRVCCSANRSGINVNEASIYEFFNSNYVKEMRATMERGEWPEDCLKCKRYEDQGLPSLRTVAKNIHDEGLPRPELRYMDLQFSNKCNLGCRMCWSGQSSIIAEEEGIYVDYKWNKDIVLDFDKFESLQSIYLTGGETLLVKHNYEFLKKIVELDLAKNITFICNTNCTVFTDEFANLIKNFKKVSIHLSIDGIGKVQEYIRWPSSWETVEKTFQKWLAFQNQNENVKIHANPTIQLLNAPYMDEYIEYFTNHDVFVHTNVLENPNFFDLVYAPDQVWELIDKQDLKNDDIRSVINLKRKSRQSINLIEKAKNYLQLQDKLRKINLEDYEPYFGFLSNAEI